MAIARDGRGCGDTCPVGDPVVTGSGSSWTESCRYWGSWWNETPGVTIELWNSILKNGIVVVIGGGPTGVVGSTIGDGGVWYSDMGYDADTSAAFRVNIARNGVVQNSNMMNFKSYAAPIGFGTLVAGNVVATQSELNFSGQWYPRTNESTAIAYLQYKKTTDVAWTTGVNSGAVSGYGVQTLATTVTGLTDGTSYQFRLYVTRTTANETTATSSTVTAATLASTPILTTEAATSVSHNSAVLNGTIDANLLTVDCTFLWNKSAQRTVVYNDGVNVTAGTNLVVGNQAYVFKDDVDATGAFDYSGQPTAGDQVDIEDTTYTFVDEVAPVAGTLTYGGQPLNGESVEIPSATYIFKEPSNAGGELAYVNLTNVTAGKFVTIPAGLDPDGVYKFVVTVAVAGDVKIGASADASMTNLERAINNSGGTSGVGNDYIAFDFGAGPAFHPMFEGTIDTGANVLYIDALNPGSAYNLTVTTDEATITVTSPSGGDDVEAPGDVLVGATADDTFTNLSRAINNSGGTPGVGSDYIAFDFGGGPDAHDLFSASIDTGLDEVTLTPLGIGSGYSVVLVTDVALLTLLDPIGGSQVAVAGDVLIGATADDTFLNLARAINKSGGTEGVGEDYISLAGASNPYVSAVHDAGGNVVDLTAKAGGSIGNSITLNDSSAAITTTAMASGADLPGSDDYEVLIGDDSDATMLNLTYAINKSGGTEGINYVALAVHPTVVATIDQLLDEVFLTVPTNANPSITFTTNEATFTLATDAENPWAQETAVQTFSNDGVTQFSASLSGLSIERTYYYKAKVVYTANGGGTLYGVDSSFATGTEPNAAAVEEEHMQTIQFDGHFGATKLITFTLRAPSGSSSDLFYTGAAPLPTDCLVFQNGVYYGTAANVPARVLQGAVAIYTLNLSAGEMSAEMVDVVIHDASGAAFRDAHVQVRTIMRLSQLNVDAVYGPANESAIRAVGNGDGHGIFATSTGDGGDINAILSSMWLRVAFAQLQTPSPNGMKIRLDSGAETTDHYYNGCIVAILGGDGAGQARVITEYDGGQREATVDAAWSTIPNNTSTYAIGPGARPWSLAPVAALSQVPTPTAGYGEMLQLLFQRFAFKIKQTASAQTWCDENGADIFDRSVSDDGVEQTVDMLENV